MLASSGTSLPYLHTIQGFPPSISEFNERSVPVPSAPRFTHADFIWLIFYMLSSIIPHPNPFIWYLIVSLCFFNDVYLLLRVSLEHTHSLVEFMWVNFTYFWMKILWLSEMRSQAKAQLTPMASDVWTQLYLFTMFSEHLHYGLCSLFRYWG